MILTFNPPRAAIMTRTRAKNQGHDVGVETKVDRRTDGHGRFDYTFFAIAVGNCTGWAKKVRPQTRGHTSVES